jgi:hypothetical protein
MIHFAVASPGANITPPMLTRHGDCSSETDAAESSPVVRRDDNDRPERVEK